MRTTINIDEDVLQAARAMARAEGRGIGLVISDLARRGLLPPQPRIDDDDGFPVFRTPSDSRAITGEMVRAALEEG